jgi:hypothetical protein
MWQLRKGSTITPNDLQWLADTIGDYHWQLSPDWTTESDRCDEIELSAPLYSNSSNIRQRANTDMCPYDGIRRGFLGIEWR